MGVRETVSSDTGSFCISWRLVALERACTHAAGPYHYENFDIEGLHIIQIIHRLERSGDLALHRPVLQQRRC